MRTRITLILASIIVAAATNAFAAGDREAGEKIFKSKCAVCHTVETGKNRVGPHLKGVVGRAAGSVEGFKYSSNMKESKIVWNEDQLNLYLEEPKKLVPKGTMAFIGLKKTEEREHVIEFLKSQK